MTIVGLALGSRGDVQPMAALIAALHARGVPSIVVVPRDLAGVAAELGATVREIPADSTGAFEVAHSTSGRLMAPYRAGQALLLRTWVRQVADAVADTVLDVVAPGDTVLSGVLTRDVATSLAQGRSCSPVTVVHTAQLPTQHRESHFSPDLFTPHAAYNRWGSRLSWTISTALGMPASRVVRSRLGLPRRSARVATREGDRYPTVVAASPLVVPPAPDWPAGTYQTGYLAPPDTNITPPPELVAFLAAGPRPAYVGFGSLAGLLPAGFARTIVEAAARSGRRIVTPALPGAPLGLLAPDVLAIGPVPHGWLFPQLAGVIHHGGAGTTWAGLRSGVPSAAIPFGVDQPFHAARLAALGVGPEPLPARAPTPAVLARHLAELTSGAYDARAAEVATLARAEDGVDATIDLLDRWGLLQTTDQ